MKKKQTNKQINKQTNKQKKENTKDFPLILLDRITYMYQDNIMNFEWKQDDDKTIFKLNVSSSFNYGHIILLRRSQRLES